MEIHDSLATMRPATVVICGNEIQSVLDEGNYTPSWTTKDGATMTGVIRALRNQGLTTLIMNVHPVGSFELPTGTKKYVTIAIDAGYPWSDFIFDEIVNRVSDPLNRNHLFYAMDMSGTTDV